MKLLIKYSPEMNVYTVDDGQRMPRIIEPRDFAPGARLEPLAPVFAQAREAVETGKAIAGISVEV